MSDKSKKKVGCSKQIWKQRVPPITQTSKYVESLVSNLDKALIGNFNNNIIQEAFGNHFYPSLMNRDDFWKILVDAIINKLGEHSPKRLEAAASWIYYEVGHRITHNKTIIHLPPVITFYESIQHHFEEASVSRELNQRLTNKILVLALFSHFYADEMVAHLLDHYSQILEFAVNIISNPSNPDVMIFFALLFINRCLMAIDSTFRQDRTSITKWEQEVTEYERQISNTEGQTTKLLSRFQQKYMNETIPTLRDKVSKINSKLNSWKLILEQLIHTNNICDKLRVLCHGFDAFKPGCAVHVDSIEEARAVNRKAAAQMTLFRLESNQPGWYNTPSDIGLESSMFKRERPKAPNTSTPNLGILNLSHGYWVCGSHHMYTTYHPPKGILPEKSPQAYSLFTRIDSNLAGDNHLEDIEHSQGYYFEVKVLTLASIRIGFCQGVSVVDFEGSDMCGCRGSICIDPVLRAIYVHGSDEPVNSFGPYILPNIKEGDTIGCFFKIIRSDNTMQCEFHIRGKSMGGRIKNRSTYFMNRDCKYFASLSVSAFNTAIIITSREHWKHRPPKRLVYEVPKINKPNSFE